MMSLVLTSQMLSKSNLSCQKESEFKVELGCREPFPIHETFNRDDEIYWSFRSTICFLFFAQSEQKKSHQRHRTLFGPECFILFYGETVFVHVSCESIANLRIDGV